MTRQHRVLFFAYGNRYEEKCLVDRMTMVVTPVVDTWFFFFFVRGSLRLFCKREKSRYNEEAMNTNEDGGGRGRSEVGEATRWWGARAAGSPLLGPVEWCG